MTRIFHASSGFAVLQLVAGIDAGLFGGPGEPRVLVLSGQAAIPELRDDLEVTPAVTATRDRFDRVVSWNRLIAPLDPSAWLPPPAEEPMLSRLVTDSLGIAEGADELVLAGALSAAGRALALLVPDCPITVLVDRVADYGTSRVHLREDVGARVHRRLHLDLLPGVEPLLLQAWPATTERLATDALRRVMDSLPNSLPVPQPTDEPVLVGQGLTSRELLTAEQELAVYAGALDGLAARGHVTAVFRPHPEHDESALAAALRRHGDALGAAVSVATDGLPVEAWLAATRPALVVAAPGTALFAARLLGIDVAVVGADVLLETIAPYENPARTAVTLADATLPSLRADGTLVDPPPGAVDGLLRAVGYCMHAARSEDLRADAERYVAAHGADRYFKNRRLAMLGLVPSPEAGVRTAAGQDGAVATGRLTRAAKRLRTGAARRAGPVA